MPKLQTENNQSSQSPKKLNTGCGTERTIKSEGKRIQESKNNASL